jgi:hypothetical protein
MEPNLSSSFDHNNKMTLLGSGPPNDPGSDNMLLFQPQKEDAFNFSPPRLFHETSTSSFIGPILPPSTCERTNQERCIWHCQLSCDAIQQSQLAVRSTLLVTTFMSDYCTRHIKHTRPAPSQAAREFLKMPCYRRMSSANRTETCGQKSKRVNSSYQPPKKTHNAEKKYQWTEPFEAILLPEQTIRTAEDDQIPEHTLWPILFHP